MKFVLLSSFFVPLLKCVILVISPVLVSLFYSSGKSLCSNVGAILSKYCDTVNQYS